MTTRALDDFYHGFHDHEAWARQCLSIRDKAGATVPLGLWPAQAKLSALIGKLRERRKPVRIVVLKPRRVAMSVAVSAEFFHRAPFQRGQHAMVVAHQLDAAAEIFDYYQQFQETYKPYGGLIALPTVKSGSAGRVIRWSNGSWVRVATANNLKTGRAFSVRFLNLSEFAFYRDARTLMVALMQCVPDDPDTMVIVDSTANGAGGRFFELWKEASDAGGSSPWTPLFFAWWEHPEYRRRLEAPPDAFQRSLGKSERYGDELAERAKYSLTLEQLYWRRWAIDSKCEGSADLFRQEYPGCPEEAFLGSGRPRFSHEALGRMAIVRDPLRGRLEWRRVGTRQQVILVPHERGELAVYRKPELGRRYVIGADCATGQDIRDGRSGTADPDWSVASVLDADTGEQVAKYRARVEEPAFGEMLDALGRYYGDAYIVPEANSYGRGVIAEVLRRGYPPSLLYQMQRETYDRASTSLNKLGFLTTEVTRPQLISALDAAIREYSIVIRDANTLAECLTFVINPRGRAEGQADCHDDEVLALALAVVGLRTAPRPARRAAAGASDRIASAYGRRRFPERGEPD